MPTRKCPFCAEEIQSEAIKCKHCNSWLQAQAPPNHQGPWEPAGWAEGSAPPPPPPPVGAGPSRLYRSSSRHMLAGVCAGFGAYLGIDPTLVRLLYIIGTVVSGILPGILAYVILAFVIPVDTSSPTWT